ncbi:MAG: hypothetical protein K9I94_12585, partial [Bacteroidales bacterium]|nr:hypothetical protein [Bacteroidales bacterium]
WDVRNVTTIVGLRPFNADSKILPEQAIGRGLRKMYPLDVEEKLTVIGTQAFIDFVEELKTEGVEFQYSPMGEGAKRKNPVIIEVDKDNPKKDIEALDIPLPQLSPRIYREYKKLDQIDLNSLEHEKAGLKHFDENELKEIVFVDIDNRPSHKTMFKDNIPDYRNVIGYLTQRVMIDNRLVGGFDALYPKVEAFICNRLFGKQVEIDDPQIMRNLSEAFPKKILFDTFRKAINDLTITDHGQVEVRNFVSLRDVKPKVTSNQPFLMSKKSVFNKTIGDNPYELEVAAFFENHCDDIVAYAKNTTGEGGVNFKMEYQATDGNIRDYFPDFFVKKDEQTTYIIETKGREETNDLKKIGRLQTWCKDMNALQDEQRFYPLYIKQEDWEKHHKDLKNFLDIAALFRIKEV